MGGDAEPRFLLSLFLLALYPCSDLREHGQVKRVPPCIVYWWMQQAHDLGAVIGKVSRRPVVMDVFSQCTADGEHTTAAGVTVRGHPEMPPELANMTPLLVARKPKSLMSITLLKWAAMGITDSEFVTLMDMDLDPFLPSLQAQSEQFRVAHAWLDMFARIRAHGADLVSKPDHTAPVNAAFMILR